MKKQLSTAMAAAMAFGTVVPAFTNEVNAATVSTQVDLSTAYTFLGEEGVELTAEQVKNGVPVLTRAQVYNYNGANADDRDAHTLKPVFEGADILFEQQNVNDASKDLFVLAKADDAKLNTALAEKEVMDAQLIKEQANGNTVETFEASDFEIVKEGTSYKYSNATLEKIASYYTSATRDAKTELADSLNKEGLKINNEIVVNLASKITELQNTIDSKNATAASLKTTKASLQAVVDNASIATAELDSLLSQYNSLKTASESALDAALKADSAGYAGSSSIEFVTAHLTPLEDKKTTITDAINSLDATKINKIKIEVTNSDGTIDASGNAGSGITSDYAKNVNITEDVDNKKLVGIVDDSVGMGKSLTTETEVVDRTKTLIDEISSAATAKINAINSTLATLSTSADAQLLTKYQGLQQTQESDAKTALVTLIDAINKNSNIAVDDLKAELVNASVMTKDDQTTEATLALDTNKNLTINETLILNNTNVTYTELYVNLREALEIFFEGCYYDGEVDLAAIANAQTLKDEISSYDASVATVGENKVYNAGRTVKVVLNNSTVVGTYTYNNEYKVKADATDAEKLYAQITKGLSGLDKEAKNVTITSGKVELNFKHEGFTAKEDRVVYEVLNKIKYTLENLKDQVVCEVNEYGTNNVNTRVDVYVKGTDGKADKTQKVITLNLLDAIQIRENVAGQPSVVDIPAIESTDFANITWAQNEIVDAMLAGYIDTTTEFRPKDSITRAEFAKIVCTVFGVDTRDEAVKNLVNPFQDVKEGEWYYKYIVALYNEGTKGAIIGGRENGNFDPKGNITRQEAAKMVAAVYDLKIQPLNTVGDNKVDAAQDGVVEKVVAVNGQTIHVDSLTKFTDDKEIASWADESITELVKENVIKGYEDGSFKPNEEIKRVDALYMLVKANKQITADDSDIATTSTAN